MDNSPSHVSFHLPLFFVFEPKTPNVTNLKPKLVKSLNRKYEMVEHSLLIVHENKLQQPLCIKKAIPFTKSRVLWIFFKKVGLKQVLISKCTNNDSNKLTPNATFSSSYFSLSRLLSEKITVHVQLKFDRIRFPFIQKHPTSMLTSLV